MRHDLLALTEDDLALLSNRGIVKRARREFDTGEFTVSIAEAENGDLTFEWSDPARVTLYADRTLKDAACSVPSAGIPRQVLRSVFAYQAQCTSTAMSAASGPTAIQQTPQDPADITDEALAQVASAAVVARAKALLRDGQPVLLHRGAKPTAHFPMLSLGVRFAVAGDIRHAHCECTDAKPCPHTVAAALAFRLLPRERVRGLAFETDGAAPNAPVLAELEELLRMLLDSGFGSLPEVLLHRLGRAEDRLNDAGFPWLADLLAELALEHERYRSRDARFDPRRIAELAAESIVRIDAATNGAPLPRAFTVGAPLAFAAAESSTAQYEGLGTEAQVFRGGARLVTYLHHRATGTILFMEREWSDPEPDPKNPQPPPTLARLARTTIQKGFHWHSLGAGTMTLKGGKRSAAGRLQIGRSPVSVQPDGLRWESLRTSVRCESYGDARERLSELPPELLRPRRRAELLLVLPVAAVESVRFDPRANAVAATLRDVEGAPAELRHPWTSRGAAGAELLLGALASGTPRWISAHVRLSGGMLRVQPIALVLEEPDGRRRLLQPWVDAAGYADERMPESGAATVADPTPHPAHAVAAEVLDRAGELFVLGVRQHGAGTRSEWEALAARAESCGFAELPASARAVAEALQRSAESPGRDGREPCAAVFAAIAQAAFLHRAG